MQYRIDATNKKLGRLAVEIALILQGKKNAAYEPRLVGGDKVVVINVNKLVFSGKKLEQKKYHHHTGYLGHLKSVALEKAFKKNPLKVLRHAVEHMLPKNRLLKKRLRNLTIQ